METVQEIVKKIEAQIVDTEVRHHAAMSEGEIAHQGDLYVHRVTAAHPRGLVMGKSSVQVALGTGNGARHMAVGAVRVYAGTILPEWVKPPTADLRGQMTGPVIVAKKRWTLEHPEHAHHSLPAGTYQVSYQYDPRTMQRTID